MYIFVAVPVVSFFFISLVTQIPPKISQFRTRLENKSGSHERQQHGDFDAHQLISYKPLNNHSRKVFNHCQLWAENEPLIQLLSNPGLQKVTQTCGYLRGQVDTLLVPACPRPKACATHFISLLSPYTQKHAQSFNSSLNLSFSGHRIPRTDLKSSSDNLLKSSQNFSNNLSQRWNRHRVSPLEVKRSL